jgi:hypothetical protein
MFPAPDSKKNQASANAPNAFDRNRSQDAEYILQSTACGKVTGREPWYHALLNALLVLNVVARYMSIRTRKR